MALSQGRATACWSHSLYLTCDEPTRLLTTSLLGGTLLSALLGCSKKKDAISDATGSYRLDNAPRWLLKQGLHEHGYFTLQEKGSTLPYYFSISVATLSTTNNGGFSGTFAGKIISFPGSPTAPYTTIADGKFTNGHP